MAEEMANILLSTKSATPNSFIASLKHIGGTAFAWYGINEYPRLMASCSANLLRAGGGEHTLTRASKLQMEYITNKTFCAANRFSHYDEGGLHETVYMEEMDAFTYRDKLKKDAVVLFRWRSSAWFAYGDVRRCRFDQYGWRHC
ncbi:MAG: hypothetical protein ACLTQI_06910 [Slackia sp.]